MTSLQAVAYPSYPSLSAERPEPPPAGSIPAGITLPAAMASHSACNAIRHSTSVCVLLHLSGCSIPSARAPLPCLQILHQMLLRCASKHHAYQSLVRQHLAQPVLPVLSVCDISLLGVLLASAPF